MKNVSKILIVFALIVNYSCKKNDDTEVEVGTTTLQIGSYEFTAPGDFYVVEGTGIDSLVGDITNGIVSMSFDYGWYTGPATNLPSDEYEVLEDEVEGQYRQIVRPIDPAQSHTRIHLYDIEEAAQFPFSYNSLTISTSGLSAAEQATVITMFYSGVPID
ncbi:hypothetical protein [Ulvibacter antarcticus]|uniref:Uncharacterized protein n=1 Tax=Ulvibacter antarcticus TaxID=442714 RepID=A0A3L9Z030_9FLAO|nr:hypothetical protein [Ulvibacter antarcticus]RMA66226.1 hypothetical protein BXY75_0646 [Ulvibacter antarcticus]